MLGALAAAAGRIVGLGDWQGGVEELLARLGPAMAVQRAALHQVGAGADGTLSEACLSEWRAPQDGAAPPPDGAPPPGRPPPWAVALGDGRPFRTDDATLDGPSRAALEETGARALLLVPVMLDGVWWGQFAVEDGDPGRAWSAGEVDVLTTAAAMLAGAIQRTRMDAELHRSETRKQAIVDCALDCILAIDAAGLLVEFNPAAERTLGFRRHDVLGRRLEELIVPPAWREAHRAGFTAYLAGRGGTMIGRRVEMTCLRADGSTFPAELSITPTPVGEELFFTAYLRDITERKAAELALLEAKTRAEAAVQARTTFLANMSHELRTPLHAIIGFSELIRDAVMGPLGDPKYREFAGDIVESGRQLLGIINDVLDVSRIEAGEHRLAKETIDLGAVVRSALNMVRDRAVKGEVTLIDDTGVLPVGLHADRRAVMTILVNLLSNAVKFTPPGGSARVSVAMEEDGTLALTVADTGGGIPAEAQARVFEPFQQADTTLSRRHEGAGLGLTITRALVERHGGAIDLSSTPGSGTTVTVRFPPAER